MLLILSAACLVVLGVKSCLFQFVYLLRNSAVVCSFV